jgi:hypothetical protein
MPERLTLLVAGKRRSYVPDFRIRRGATIAMVDVLHRNEVKSPFRPAVTATIEAAYATIGIVYRALTEQQVVAEPRLGNARLVLEHRGADPRAETEMALVQALNRRGEHTVASLVAALPRHADARDVLFRLACDGKVRLGLWARTPGEMRAELLLWKGLS